MENKVADITNEFGTFKFESNNRYDLYLKSVEKNDDKNSEKTEFKNHSLEEFGVENWAYIDYYFNKFCGKIKSGEKEYSIELLTDTAYGTTCEKSMETLKLFISRLGDLTEILKDSIMDFDMEALIDTILENAPEKLGYKSKADFEGEDIDDDDDEDDNNESNEEDDDDDEYDFDAYFDRIEEAEYKVADILINEVGTEFKCFANGLIVMNFDDPKLVHEYCDLNVRFNLITGDSWSFMDC